MREAGADAILNLIMGTVVGWRIAPGSLEAPLVVAHRAGGGMAPENTMAAIHRAMEIGVDAVELDVRLTKDGKVVVFHDRKLDRTSNGAGPVGTHTLSEMKSLDVGSWYGPRFKGERVLTLEEVFADLPSDFPIYVEAKARGPGALPLAVKIVNIIRKFRRWESTLVGSFNPAVMMLLRVVDSRVFRGYIWSARHPLPLRARWFSPLVRPHWCAPDRKTLTPRLLARLHAQGKPVIAWDQDVGTDMVALKKMRLDAVVTDFPEALVCQK